MLPVLPDHLIGRVVTGLDVDRDRALRFRLADQSQVEVILDNGLVRAIDLDGLRAATIHSARMLLACEVQTNKGRPTFIFEGVGRKPDEDDAERQYVPVMGNAWTRLGGWRT